MGFRKQRRANSTADIDETDVPNVKASAAATPSRSASPMHFANRTRLPPRDWSEVLGMAALLGWNSTVIDRTMKRCSVLFGEGMELRAMPATVSGQARDTLVRYTPHMDSTTSSSNNSRDDKVNLITINVGYPCPHDACTRRHDPYTERWELRQHLKRTHKHSVDEISEFIDQANRTNESIRPQIAARAPRTTHFLDPVTVRLPNSTLRRR
jgi:hypothetical protein